MFTNDTPIAKPEDDHFGIDPFAQALAKAISTMNAPEGVVIGINGPWGSGKSSAINLILYHLREAIESGKLKIVRFSPWWLSGTEAITAAFLEDLLTAIGPSTGDTALKFFRKVAQRLSGFSKVAEAGANAALPGAGGLVGGALQALEKIVPGEEGIEAQHKKVSEVLAKADARYLVIIDDIDRLGPDEAIEVFKLVKSVGQLSNLIYLLAFDRQLAEKIVADKFPSEGPHYLEKILQAAFEVPPASVQELRFAFLAQVDEVCPPKEGEDQLRFMNVMLEGVTPLLKSPRDLNRLIGMLRVTWAAVADEVERADFVTMEALRLFMSDFYRSVRANPDRLTGYMTTGMDRNTGDLSAEYNDIFLATVPERERERVRRTLRRLFPKLDAVWGNVHHQSDGSAQRFRRVCSADHFNTYFRFAIGEDVLPASAITALVTRAGDKEFIKSTLRDALKVKRQSGHTRASLYLDQVRAHADRIAKEDAGEFIKALFEIGDDLDIPDDEGRGFYQRNNNERRLWFLIRAVLEDRFDLTERSSIVATTIQAAQLYTLVTLAERCKSQHNKGSYDNSLVDVATSEKLAAVARERLRAAARDRSLATHQRLFNLLWAWTRTGDCAFDEVRETMREWVGNNQFILNFASSAAGRSWSISPGDFVSQARLSFSREAISSLIDTPTFLSRLKEIASNTENPDEATFVNAFMQAWENPDHPDITIQGEAPAALASEKADESEVAAVEPASVDQSQPEE
jgi:predicted KAP-like P-loop ATPase